MPRRGAEAKPLAGTLIAISERGLDEAGNIKGFLVGGKTPGEFTVKRSATSTSAIARCCPTAAF